MDVAFSSYGYCASGAVDGVELRRAWGGGPEERDLVLRQGVVWLAWALLVLPLSALVVSGDLLHRSVPPAPSPVDR